MEFVCNGVDLDTGEPLLPSFSALDIACALEGRPEEAPNAAAFKALLESSRLEPLQSALADALEGDERAHTLNLEAAHKRRTSPHLGTIRSVDPDKLEQARYAVLLPAPETPEEAAEQEGRLEALAPLLALRAEQQGREVEVIRVPREASWDMFLMDRGTFPGDADPEKLPYYLLILGEPTGLSFPFQTYLDGDRATGRLSLDSHDDYRAYAEAVCAAAPRRRALSLWGPAYEIATLMSANELLRPLQAAFGDKVDVTARLADEATKASFFELLSEPSGAGLLLTASHGAGARAGDPRQREKQGGLVVGPKDKLRGADRLISAADIPPGLKLDGMMAFCFACFGGGTPRWDSFMHTVGGQQRTERVQLAPEPFVAALPKRLLAQGALAVIAHIDRAWEFGFRRRQPGGPLLEQIEHFREMVEMLLEGRTVGEAMEPLGRRYSALATVVAADQARLHRGEHVDRVQAAWSWLRYEDARTYSLLGCPATRLQLSNTVEVTP